MAIPRNLANIAPHVNASSTELVVNDGGANLDFRVEGDTDANLLFVDAGNDKLGIGTSSPSHKLDVEASAGNGTFVAEFTNTNSASDGRGIINLVGNSSGAVSTLVFAGGRYFGTDNDTLAVINNAAAGGISFCVGGIANSTRNEKARITSGGYFKASDTGSYVGTAGSYHELNQSLNDNLSFIIRSTGSPAPNGVAIRFTAASPDNNTSSFLECADSTATRMYIYSDGDVWTSDAGTLSSDQKLKNSITDASPKLDDVMRLRVRNFYWNEDYHPKKTDKKLIGFIAQEFEEVFPGLVTDGVIRGGNPIYEDQAVVDEEGNPVLDEEGNAKTEQVKVGETEKEYAKGIKEGKLIPILVKALQEAVERIETLEAKVAALEAQ